MADRRLIAQDITDSGQVEQIARGALAAYGDRAVAFIATTLFSWVIAHIDDDGRIIGKPAALRSKIFARYLDLVSEDEVAEVVAWMNDVDLMVWYEVRGSPGERYLYSPRFTVHQTLRADRYGPSRHPAPPSWRPEEGHPYTKSPDLMKAKAQRDARPTLRVPKRPINKGARPLWETGPRPERDQSATTAQPERVQDGADWLRSGDGSPAPPPLLSSPLASPPLSAAAQRGAADAERGYDAPERAERIIAETPEPWRSVLELAYRATESPGLVTVSLDGSRLEERAPGKYAALVRFELSRDHLVAKGYAKLLQEKLAEVTGLRDVELSIEVAPSA